MKRTFLLPLAIVCLAPALAVASPAGSGDTRAMARRAPEPLHVQLARVVFPREKWHSFLTEASAELTKQIADTGKGQIELEPGFADRLREKYETLVPYEEMLHYQARLLGSQYSRPELRQLLTFYRTRRQAIIVAHKKFLLSRVADLRARFTKVLPDLLSGVADAFGANFLALIGAFSLAVMSFGATVDRRRLLVDLDRVLDEDLFSVIASGTDAQAFELLLGNLREGIHEIATVGEGLGDLRGAIANFQSTLGHAIVGKHGGQQQCRCEFHLGADGDTHFAVVHRG